MTAAFLACSNSSVSVIGFVSFVSIGFFLLVYQWLLQNYYRHHFTQVVILCKSVMVSETTNEQPPFETATESLLLKASYKKSGLTVADLAAATGLSVGAISIALSGVRYRDGGAKAAVPSDRTLVRLSSVLRIDPEVWRQIGRDRAAELLAEAIEAGDIANAPADAEAVAAAAGRAALARQVLAAFSSDELRAELARREPSVNSRR